MAEPIKTQDLISALDELRVSLESYDGVELQVVESRKVVEQAEQISNDARQVVLTALDKLLGLLSVIKDRYSKPAPVAEVETSFPVG